MSKICTCSYDESEEMTQHAPLCVAAMFENVRAAALYDARVKLEAEAAEFHTAGQHRIGDAMEHFARKLTRIEDRPHVVVNRNDVALVLKRLESARGCLEYGGNPGSDIGQAIGMLELMVGDN